MAQYKLHWCRINITLQKSSFAGHYIRQLLDIIWDFLWYTELLWNISISVHWDRSKAKVQEKENCTSVLLSVLHYGKLRLQKAISSQSYKIQCYKQFLGHFPIYSHEKEKKENKRRKKKEREKDTIMISCCILLFVYITSSA